MTYLSTSVLLAWSSRLSLVATTCLMVDWFGTGMGPRSFAINSQLQQNAIDGARLKAHGLVQLRLFETIDDVPLPLALASVALPLTWQSFWTGEDTILFSKSCQI